MQAKNAVSRETHTNGSRLSSELQVFNKLPKETGQLITVVCCFTSRTIDIRAFQLTKHLVNYKENRKCYLLKIWFAL